MTSPALQKLVLASNNKGKMREFSALLAPLGMELIAQADLGVSEAEEPHCTFVENALAKARHASQQTGLPALADDSGICITALSGAPGVLSARYGGEPKSDERNNAAVMAAMAGKTDRRAHYVAVLVLVRSANDPQPIIVEGEWHGQLLDAARGEGGFGYDPYFWLPDLGQSAGELDAVLKNSISHRGVATRRLLERLQASVL